MIDVDLQSDLSFTVFTRLFPCKNSLALPDNVAHLNAIDPYAVVRVPNHDLEVQ